MDKMCAMKYKSAHPPCSGIIPLAEGVLYHWLSCYKVPVLDQYHCHHIPEPEED